MKNSIKRAQSQACLGFAERKNFRPLAKLEKLSLTLVALLSMATGAWALPENEVTVSPVTGQTNQWTFTMPAGNVELTPIYAPEFTATFKAGNDLTIQDGKATVTVTESGATTGTQATLDENGKLTPLYEGQTITMTAAPGYKFKSVEVKKEVPTPLDNATTAWTAGTYAVPTGGLTYSDAITVSGDVTLVLTDGETLTLNKGISLAEGATLTVEGEGAMQVNGTAGNNVDMGYGNHGAKAGHGTDAIKGCETSKLIVNGGTVTAAGGNGGYVYTTHEAAWYCDGGNGGAGISVALTVNGGTLTAIGGTGGTHADSTGGHDGTNGQGINSTFTAGTGISFSDSDNGTDWTANTGTSSTKQYVKAE